MKDRVPLYPGRVTLTPVAGQANTYDMVRADQPTQEGTPLNKANLLADATAGRFGLSGDGATVNGVLDAIGQKFCLKTDIITSTSTWTMPAGVKDNTIQVRLFGGGGGGASSSGGGGGGGEMAVQSIALTPGTQVAITIGAGGACGGSGGASAFGSYLSASGGAAGGYRGGSGGSGGGGGSQNATSTYLGSGGDATYGGGGGMGTGKYTRSDDSTPHGGNGGTYGGGGGGASLKPAGTGGTYGGAGSGYSSITTLNPAVDGTDTRGMGLEFEGDGKASQTDHGGGGGYGGRGGDAWVKTSAGTASCGGGGGYGADGGHGGQPSWASDEEYLGGGGGGGYGGRGGHAGYHEAGGGGGYGRSGAGGDGGDYCVGGTIYRDYRRLDRTNGGIAAGGAGSTNFTSGTRAYAGGDGICIITYTLGVSE